jgi:hypothetical protein
MKGLSAIKKFMGTQGNNPNMSYEEPKMAEMKAFLTVCTPDEKIEFGKCACELLGEPYESSFI